MCIRKTKRILKTYNTQLDCTLDELTIRELSTLVYIVTDEPFNRVYKRLYATRPKFNTLTVKVYIMGVMEIAINKQLEVLEISIEGKVNELKALREELSSLDSELNLKR